MRQAIAAMLFAAALAPLQAARADMLSVDQAGGSSPRAQVVGALEASGVPAGEARERVAALTDAEAAQLARDIEAAPAGGNGVFLFIAVVGFFAWMIYHRERLTGSR